MNLAPKIEDRLRSLPSKRRRVVVHGVNSFAQQLVEKSSNSNSLKRIEAASQAAVDTFGLLMMATSRQLDRLSKLLAEVRTEDEAEVADVEALEASGHFQVLALYRAIEEDSLSVAQLEAAGIQRQRLKQLRDQDRLFGVKLPFQRGFLYPRWQFGDDLRPKDFLPDIMKVAHEEELDAFGVHLVMTNPAAGGGTTPLELCEQGRLELALNALRGTGELGG
jgi:hypothetical protein